MPNDHPQRHIIEEEKDNDLRRWQDSIRDLLCELSGDDGSLIDGGGCDSGDPLDLTLQEIRQAWSLNQFRWIPVTEHRPPLTHDFMIILRRCPHREDGKYRMHIWSGSVPIDTTHWAKIPAFPPLPTVH
jgi:hypothetical protein